MPPCRAVRVGIGHDVERALAAQRPGVGVGRIGQHFQCPFHPPFGHGLAGVLAGDQPHRARPFAQCQAINRLAIKAGAKAAVRHAGPCGDAADQIVVRLHRIGREIGEPANVTAGAIADGQRAAIRARVPFAVGAPPRGAVFADGGAIVWPAAGIGRGVQVGDAQHQFPCASIAHAEMEPLAKIAARVGADRQTCLGPRDAQHGDIAGVKGAIDADVAVWPKGQGKGGSVHRRMVAAGMDSRKAGRMVCSSALRPHWRWRQSPRTRRRPDARRWPDRSNGPNLRAWRCWRVLPTAAGRWRHRGCAGTAWWT